MIEKILTNKEIVRELIRITGADSASDLARKLGTERQNLKSYENKATVDLNNRMLSLLITLIKQC